jgi:hypothetical protein
MTSKNVRLIRSQWISFKPNHGRTFNSYLMLRYTSTNAALVRLGLKPWASVGQWLATAAGV